MFYPNMTHYFSYKTKKRLTNYSKNSLQAVQILLNERFSRFIPCHHFVLDGSV